MQYIFQEVFSFFVFDSFRTHQDHLPKDANSTCHFSSWIRLSIQTSSTNQTGDELKRCCMVYNKKKNVQKEDGLAHLKCKAVCNEPNSAV